MARAWRSAWAWVKTRLPQNKAVENDKAGAGDCAGWNFQTGDAA